MREQLPLQTANVGVTALSTISHHAQRLQTPRNRRRSMTCMQHVPQHWGGANRSQASRPPWCLPCLSCKCMTAPCRPWVRGYRGSCLVILRSSKRTKSSLTIPSNSEEENRLAVSQTYTGKSRCLGCKRKPATKDEECVLCLPPLDCGQSQPCKAEFSSQANNLQPKGQHGESGWVI